MNDLDATSHRTLTRRAFTLVEMLLVAAILAVLAALLLPVMTRAAALARGLHCQNNLRELGKCLKQYLNDSGGEFPPMRVSARPEGLLKEMADEARLKLVDSPMAGGCHWSLLLWQYHHNLDLYICPNDPLAERRGDLTGDGVKPGSPFLDAPPESYGLNTLLFRSMPALRKMAGASWGLAPGEYQSEMTATTLNDMKRQLPRLESRVILFCGASGFTVGHQSNTAWRDSGLAQRSEWHPWPGPKPFEDARGFGSYYLFFDGRAEYREDFPSRFEWALDLK